MTMRPNHALQRTRPSRRGCNRTPSRAGSLSLGRWTNYHGCPIFKYPWKQIWLARHGVTPSASPISL